METLVLMPMEFGLAPLLTAQGAVGRLAVHSEQYVVKGTRFLPFEGTVRFARFHLEPFLPQHDVSSVMFHHLHCQHRHHSAAVYKPEHTKFCPCASHKRHMEEWRYASTNS